MERLKGRTSYRSQITLVVFCIFICGIIFSLTNVIFFQEKGDPAQSVFFNDTKDSFMDLYHPIRFSVAQDPYQFVKEGAIYPPISYLIFRGYGMLLGLDRFVSDAFVMRDLQGGRVILVLFLLSNLLPLCYIMYRGYRGSELARSLFIVLAVTSGPFLFLLERANILLLVFWLTFLFVLFHNSPKKWLQELALISLALAAAIKLYPAIFGLLLLQTRQFKEAIRCAIYGILLFFVPFFYFNGIATIGLFIQNLLHGISVTVIGPYRVDWAATIGSVCGWIGLSIESGAYYAKKLLIPAMLFLLSCGLLHPQPWKKCLVITMVCVLLPSFNFYYSMVFYLIPLFLLLQEEERSPINFAYAGFLALSCALFMLGSGHHMQFFGFRFVENENVFTSWSVEIARLSQVGLLATFGIDTIFSIRSKLRKKACHLANNVKFNDCTR